MKCEHCGSEEMKDLGGGLAKCVNTKCGNTQRKPMSHPTYPLSESTTKFRDRTSRL